MNRGLTRTGNKIGVWMYRALDGRLVSTKKAPVLLLTVPGRRTGQPRSTCVRYLETADGYLVWGTASGAPKDPDWFRNLRAAATVDVQLGPNHLRAKAHELTGDDRDTMWTQTILGQIPQVARYARKAGRPIPVAVLEPLPG